MDNASEHSKLNRQVSKDRIITFTVEAAIMEWADFKHKYLSMRTKKNQTAVCWICCLELVCHIGSNVKWVIRRTQLFSIADARNGITSLCVLFEASAVLFFKNRIVLHLILYGQILPPNPQTSVTATCMDFREEILALWSMLFNSFRISVWQL